MLRGFLRRGRRRPCSRRHRTSTALQAPSRRAFGIISTLYYIPTHTHVHFCSNLLLLFSPLLSFSLSLFVSSSLLTHPLSSLSLLLSPASKATETISNESSSLQTESTTSSPLTDTKSNAPSRQAQRLIKQMYVALAQRSPIDVMNRFQEYQGIAQPEMEVINIVLKANGFIYDVKVAEAVWELIHRVNLQPDMVRNTSYIYIHTYIYTSSLSLLSVPLSRNAICIPIYIYINISSRSI